MPITDVRQSTAAEPQVNYDSPCTSPERSSVNVTSCPDPKLLATSYSSKLRKSGSSAFSEKRSSAKSVHLIIPPPGKAPATPSQQCVNFLRAVGLPHELKSEASDGWCPAWEVFPLKVFRGAEYKVLRIQGEWDDAALLSELRKTYDDLRTIWRKWFSLRNVASITMVHADHSIVYPQRLGPAKVSPSKNMRLRWFLHHPSYMKGRHEFMQVLTVRTDLGIEFVERWQLSRIAIAIMLPVLLSVVIGVVYSIAAKDPSTAFTIAGYLTSAYSVCLVLVGLLNFVDF
ncbi:hypothetical protein EVJ58_g4031 [Rhodofomes roseus]|uniref:Uncharacterized protein n=1 Tax=Rhodofomes roseus TaxID=34475 RepID=A0A4Y9YL24_9APHY|nr:hypothetical protein EVJ58_g4031 [Rhodofomes roseus]